MSQFIHILPVLTVLVAAVALMFMSMYQNKFSVKTYITVSSIVLVATLAFVFVPFGETFSVKTI